MGPPPKLANPPRECDDDGMTARLYQFMVDWRAGKYRGLWVADVHRQDNGEAIVTHTANRLSFRPTPPPAGGRFGKRGICRGSERESKHVSRLNKESLEGTRRRRLPFSHVGDDQTGTGWGGRPLQQQQHVHKAGGTPETAQSPQAVAGHSAQNYDGGGSAQHFDLTRADKRVSIENGGGFSSLPEDEKMEGGGGGATATAAPAPGVPLVRGKGGSPSSCSRINPNVINASEDRNLGTRTSEKRGFLVKGLGRQNYMHAPPLSLVFMMNATATLDCLLSAPSLLPQALSLDGTVFPRRVRRLWD
uniref:Uncharacterized protein n=1 Tax=Chromera velia CCMP2878 TaxID=1169474 RepID=A0A0G4I520_9ALVE|eukprot:Cvel_35932.t1-p1 / transcript=Cvel_35932.t1 / gene=Cvel_35932 / organism=Chromera_velia_CCMP2878 / gene_product=hypothetical protein / transcript_product=hypothetical protein / location=Cvel_scaffold6808:172-1135(-) / protein_length=303 / sequence_SO=supercontig / SO=protein_coding / is_pseudo=false